LSLPKRSLAFVISICFIVLFIFPLQSQDLEWAFSDGGHLTEQAKSVEKVPDGVVFLSSDGLEKRNDAGEQLWRFDFFDLDIYQYSSKPSLSTMTVDESGNVYAQLTFPANGPGPTTIANIDIPHGNSLIKINTAGQLLWSRKLVGSTSPKLAYHDGTIFALGVFDETINIGDTYEFENRENSDCPLGSSENTYARDIYIAKFNTIGQVKDAIIYGGLAHDDLNAVTIDKDGNLYLAINYGFSSCTPDETQLHKLNSSLETLWSKTISREYEEGNGYNVLLPSDIHIGANGKLYLWAYAFDTVISNDFRFLKTATYGYTGGLLEFNVQDGLFLNYRSIDGLSINGRRGYMSDYKEHLLVATTFRETKEFDNGSLSTNSEGEEPVLLKVDLNNFGMEYLIHLSGIPQQYHTEVKDWSGPIKVDSDDLYYSGSFSSDTLNLAPQTALYNNSGNNAQDYFLAKYGLESLDFTTAQEDTDQDGVVNFMDQCPNTPIGETTDEQGCSLTQKDSDLDGVFDDLDICMDTQQGAEVNAEGCSEEQRDADGDGVPDYRDNCEDTPLGILVNEAGCEVAILDSNLFQIKTFSEVCPNAGNGRIEILTQDNSRSYKAILNGTQETSFTSQAILTDLSPGQYELCLMANDIESDSLCFTLTIETALEVSLDGKVDLMNNTLKLELSGGTAYKINFNGRIIETPEPYVELDLEQGTNEVLVTTEHLCQGTALYRVELDTELRVAPNPFLDQIDLSPIRVAGLAKAYIYDQSGQLVYQKTFLPSEPIVLKDLMRLPVGIYLLKYSEGNFQYSQKIIKK